MTIQNRYIKANRNLCVTHNVLETYSSPTKGCWDWTSVCLPGVILLGPLPSSLGELNLCLSLSPTQRMNLQISNGTSDTVCQSWIRDAPFITKNCPLMCCYLDLNSGNELQQGNKEKTSTMNRGNWWAQESQEPWKANGHPISFTTIFQQRILKKMKSKKSHLKRGRTVARDYPSLKSSLSWPGWNFPTPR